MNKRISGWGGRHCELFAVLLCFASTCAIGLIELCLRQSGVAGDAGERVTNKQVRHGERAGLCYEHTAGAALLFAAGFSVHRDVVLSTVPMTRKLCSRSPRIKKPCMSGPTLPWTPAVAHASMTRVSTAATTTMPPAQRHVTRRPGWWRRTDFYRSETPDYRETSKKRGYTQHHPREGVFRCRVGETAVITPSALGQSSRWFHEYGHGRSVRARLLDTVGNFTPELARSGRFLDLLNITHDIGNNETLQRLDFSRELSSALNFLAVLVPIQLHQLPKFALRTSASRSRLISRRLGHT